MPYILWISDRWSQQYSFACITQISNLYVNAQINITLWFLILLKNEIYKTIPWQKEIQVSFIRKEIKMETYFELMVYTLYDTEIIIN